jgi:hypothetical protein
VFETYDRLALKTTALNNQKADPIQMVGQRSHTIPTGTETLAVTPRQQWLSRIVNVTSPIVMPFRTSSGELCVSFTASAAGHASTENGGVL